MFARGLCSCLVRTRRTAATSCLSQCGLMRAASAVGVALVCHSPTLTAQAVLTIAHTPSPALYSCSLAADKIELAACKTLARGFLKTSSTPSPRLSSSSTPSPRLSHKKAALRCPLLITTSPTRDAPLSPPSPSPRPPPRRPQSPARPRTGPHCLGERGPPVRPRRPPSSRHHRRPHPQST